MRSIRFSTIAFLVSAAGVALFAQARGGGAEWLTARGDAQRTSWIRADAAISADAIAKGGFELQWKSSLDNRARQLLSLNQGVTANGVTLFTPLSLVSGSSNNIYAVDNDTGNVFWQRHFDIPLPATGTLACPGGIAAAATRAVSFAPPAPAAGRGGGGGGGGRGGFRSVVGEPGEGVPAGAPRGGGAAAGAPAGRGAAPGAPGAAGAPGAPGAPAPGAPAGAAPQGATGQGRGAAAATDPAAAGRGGRGGAGGGGRGTVAPGGPVGRASAAAAGGGGGGFGRPSGVVYVVASDGVLHTLGLVKGKDVDKPVRLVPANAQVSDLIATNEMLYATTSAACGGAAAAVWAIDAVATDPTAISWRTNGGNPVGPIALTTDGRVIVAIGAGTAGANGYANAIVSLDPKTLQVKDWFTSANADFTTGPMVFRRGNREYIAAAVRDGRILVLDAASLGGANHSTPLYSSASLARTGAAFAPDGLALWERYAPTPPPPAAPPAAAAPAGAPPAAAPAPAQPPSPLMLGQWLLVPIRGALPAGVTASNGAVTNGAILALEVVDDAGRIALMPRWTSRDLTAPAAPLVVNGVVFGLSTGRAAATTGATAASLAQRSTPAVLYALDGTTGKELWSSGRTMTSFAPGPSFWSATGQVYVGTYDGTVHAFGFAMERK